MSWLALCRLPWNDGIEVPTEEGQLYLHGGRHPTIFKTLRNAWKAAGESGFVLRFDANALARFTKEDMITPADLERASESDLEIAERQMGLWAQLSERIRAGETLDEHERAMLAPFDTESVLDG